MSQPLPPSDPKDIVPLLEGGSRPSCTTMCRAIAYGIGAATDDLRIFRRVASLLVQRKGRLATPVWPYTLL